MLNRDDDWDWLFLRGKCDIFRKGSGTGRDEEVGVLPR